MPIINQVVSGSGGGSSVSEPYLEYSIVGGELKSTTNRVVDLTGATNIGEISFGSAYKDNSNISGAINFSSIEQTGYGVGAFARTFENCPNITSLNFSGLKTLLNGSHTFEYVCKGCTALVSVDFGSLKDTGGDYRFYEAFRNCTALISADFHNLLSLQSGNSIFKYCFLGTALTQFPLSNIIVTKASMGLDSVVSGCSGITNVTFNNLCSVVNNGLYFCFSGCSGLTSLYFPALAYSTSTSRLSNGSFTSMLSGCSGVTVHFPADWQTTMSSWANVTNGFSGTGTTVLFDLPSVTVVDWSSLTDINNVPLSYAMQYSPNITKVSMPNVTEITGGYTFSYVFYNCTSLVDVDFGSLESIYGSNFPTRNLFEGCTSLQVMKFPSLKSFTGNGNQEMFRNCTALTDIYYYALETPDALKSSANMLSGCSGVTVHFPMSLPQTGLINNTWGGTNTTVLFDIVTSLTGADSNTYTRSEKNSTSTATAWLHNNTLYYTSGTNEPSVSDAIYSDAACTTSVTTITAIA